MRPCVSAQSIDPVTGGSKTHAGRKQISSEQLKATLCRSVGFTRRFTPFLFGVTSFFVIFIRSFHAGPTKKNMKDCVDE